MIPILRKHRKVNPWGSVVIQSSLTDELLPSEKPSLKGGQHS